MKLVNILGKYEIYLERIQSLNAEYEWGEDSWIKGRLSTLQGDIKEKIKIEKMIKNQTENIIIPNFFESYVHERYDQDNVVYIIAKKRTPDGSNEYNVDSYAYIKNGDGLIVLNVHTLKSNDSYGERMFTNSAYYRSRDLSGWGNNSYYSKSYGKGHRYPDKFKKHVDFIINKLREEGFEINNE